MSVLGDSNQLGSFNQLIFLKNHAPGGNNVFALFLNVLYVHMIVDITGRDFLLVFICVLATLIFLGITLLCFKECIVYKRKSRRQLKPYLAPKLVKVDSNCSVGKFRANRSPSSVGIIQTIPEENNIGLLSLGRNNSMNMGVMNPGNMNNVEQINGHLIGRKNMNNSNNRGIYEDFGAQSTAFGKYI